MMKKNMKKHSFIKRTVCIILIIGCIITGGYLNDAVVRSSIFMSVKWMAWRWRFEWNSLSDAAG